MCCLVAGVAGFPCSPGNLAVYRLELRTFWSEDKFPKQYPQWRPSAQWSRTIGKTSQVQGTKVSVVGCLIG